jgi:hypothetical protein
MKVSYGDRREVLQELRGRVGSKTWGNRVRNVVLTWSQHLGETPEIKSVRIEFYDESSETVDIYAPTATTDSLMVHIERAVETRPTGRVEIEIPAINRRNLRALRQEGSGSHAWNWSSAHDAALEAMKDMGFDVDPFREVVARMILDALNALDGKCITAEYFETR